MIQFHSSGITVEGIFINSFSAAFSHFVPKSRAEAGAGSLFQSPGNRASVQISIQESGTSIVVKLSARGILLMLTFTVYSNTANALLSAVYKHGVIT